MLLPLLMLLLGVLGVAAIIATIVEIRRDGYRRVSVDPTRATKRHLDID